MENSQIKKTYEDILRLKEQQPDSSQILKSVIQLKELVDNAIFSVFKDLYWEHWEKSASYKEINSQHWLEILENRLLKKELWIDVSIAQLLLSTPGEISQILLSKQDNQKEENHNYELIDFIINEEEGETEEATVKENKDEDNKETLINIEESSTEEVILWEDKEDIKEENSNQNNENKKVEEKEWDSTNKAGKTSTPLPNQIIWKIFQNKLWETPKKEDLDKIWEKIKKEMDEKNSLTININQDEEKTKDSINKTFTKIVLQWYLNNNPDIKKTLLTKKEFYDWNWTTDLLFFKSELFSNFDWYNISDKKWSIFLNDFVRFFNIPITGEEKYWEAYKKVLKELFWEQWEKKEREVFKTEIKSALEEKLKNNIKEEIYWFFSWENEEDTTWDSYLELTINKQHLNTEDISRWIGIESSKTIDILNELYWKKEVIFRKEELEKKEEYQDYLKEFQLIDTELEEDINNQLMVNFIEPKTWNNVAIPTIYEWEDAQIWWLDTINEFEVFMELAWVKTDQELEEKCIKEGLDWVQEVFAKCISNCAEHMLNSYTDIRFWIGKGSREYIINSFKEKYPNADKKLDKIFSDDNFLKQVKEKYINYIYEEANILFMSNEPYKGETLPWYIYSLIDCMCNEISFWDFIGFYIEEIWDSFKKSEEDLIKEWEKNKKTVKKTDKEKAESFWISIEKYNLIKDFIDSLPVYLTAKKKKRETSKIVDLLNSWDELRIDDFCKIYEIKELSDKSYQILNHLWIKLSAPKPNTKFKKNTTTVSTSKKVESTAKKEKKNTEEKVDIEVIKTDVPNYFIKYAEINDFWILNEKQLKKQIEEYILLPQNKDCLAKSLQDKDFWHLNKKKDATKRKPQMKTKSTIYSIEVKSWAWRFIVLKIGEKYFITDFNAHKIYDRKLKGKM